MSVCSMRRNSMDTKKLFDFKPKKINRPFFFIDPGLAGSGMALFDRLDGKADIPPKPGKCWQFLPKRDQNKFETWWRVGHMSTEISTAFWDGVKSLDIPPYIIIESPEVWGNSAKSMASSASGGLNKLSMLIGAIVNEIFVPYLSNCIEDIFLIPPQNWKGQLPKEVVRKRIALAYKDKSLRFKNHTEDAVGMGLSAMGRL